MYVIMYHYVRNIKNSRYSKIKGLEYNFFKQQIEFLEKHHFQFVTLSNVTNITNISDNSILLTFDDGYLDHYLNVFPILNQKGIQGVFSMPGKIIREKKVLDVNKIHFILAGSDKEVIKKKLFEKMNYYRGLEFDFPPNQELYNKLAIANRFDDKDIIFIKRILQVELPEMLRNKIVDELFREVVTDQESAFVDELYMSMDQIRTMKQHGMVFGIHGYDHYWMNHLTKQELKNDISQALEVFEDIVDFNNWTCCYPYGSYNDEVIKVVKDMGATSGIGTRVAAYDPKTDDKFKIPRLDTNDFPPKSDNYKNFI